MTTNTSDVVSAIRELTNTKQLERTELLDLLKDGLHAALVKRYGPNVRAEIGIDELKGTIRIVVLRTVVETVEDPGAQVALEEARFERSEEHTSELQSRLHLVCRLLLEKKKKKSAIRPHARLLLPAVSSRDA